MSTYILPAGTVVKFGTISTSLYTYFREGIPKAVPREGLQIPLSENENLPISGINVGELMAYFAAYATFAQRTSQVHAQYQSIMSKFVAVLQNAYGERPQMPELETVATEAGLPVVLEIILGEDCEVYADQHFESLENAERSWKLWRSVFLTRSNGIPSTWIKKFYFPRLLEYRDVTSANNSRLLEQTTDSALMVGGLMQSWHKDAPGELMIAFKRQYGRSNFSQSFNFDETSLERFFNLTGMLDPATRLLNQMTIWQDVDSLARKQKIPLL